MNETYVTLVGNIATDVRSATSQSGVPITSFRVASTTRRFDRGRGWSDLDTLFVTVVCWRQLAENVATSFAKGDPVVVSGRMRMRQWTADDGRSGTAIELEASSAGHDLSRGVSSFTRSQARSADRPGRSEADLLAEAVAREPLGAAPDLAHGTDERTESSPATNGAGSDSSSDSGSEAGREAGGEVSIVPAPAPQPVSSRRKAAAA